MTKPSPNAVVLLSGGLDSATSLAIAKHQGYTVNALTFRYGQRHEHELAAARRIVAREGVANHVVQDIDLRVFGGSALTSNIEVPKDRSQGQMSEGIPVTYVPARNTIFLAFALAFAEVIGCKDIFIGVNSVDYSGYPDCRPEFIKAFENVGNLATKASVEGHERLRIHAPLIRLTKPEIIKVGLELGVDYSLTHTCYDPGPEGHACGRCDACSIRIIGFAEIGEKDPATYQ